jgi:hypothetical protein
MDPLFQPLPENLADLTLDELTVWMDGALSVMRAVREDPDAVRGERSDDDFIAELEAGAAAIETVQARIDELRAAAEPTEPAAPPPLSEERIERIRQLTSIVVEGDASDDDEDDPRQRPEADDDGEGDGSEPDPDAADDDEGEPEEDDPRQEQPDAEQKPEPVAAGTRPTVVPRRNRPTRRTEQVRQPVYAAPGVRGMSAGAQFHDRDQLVRALGDKMDALQRIPNGGIVKEFVAHVDKGIPEDRVLTAGSDPITNTKVIERVIGGAPGSSRQVQALAASGGICAPLTPTYDIPTFGSTATPVGDALPTIGAPRGGVSFFPPMPWYGPLNAIDDALSVISLDQDAAGGTAATKTCQRIDCPDPQTAYIKTFATCIEIGNLQGRTWPELVDAFMSNLEVARAASLEVDYLNAISALSTKLVSDPVGGVLTTLIPLVRTLRAGIISRNRLDRNSRFRAWFPAWLPDMMVADTRRSQFDRFRAEAEITGLLNDAGITASYYLDSATGKGQVFPGQAANTDVAGFPATMVWYLFPEGTFTKLDGGSLDLGVVRDSTLNATNDYQIFSEEWHGIAKMGGPETYEVTSTLCDTGMTAGAEQYTCGGTA